MKPYESLIPKKEEVKFSRIWEMPNKNTFEISCIKDLVLRYLKPSSIDPFCGECTLADVRNDINQSKLGQFHLRSDDFLKEILQSGKKFKTVLFDPPYSLRQVKEVYENYGCWNFKDTQNSIRWTIERDLITKLTEPGSHVISCGWSSTCMGKKRNFEIVEILLVSHGPAHNDTIVTVERKVKP